MKYRGFDFLSCTSEKIKFDSLVRNGSVSLVEHVLMYVHLSGKLSPILLPKSLFLWPWEVVYSGESGEFVFVNFSHKAGILFMVVSEL